MFDILFLSRLIPQTMDAEVRSKMSNTMDDAAIAWQWQVIEGLEKNIGTTITLFNYLPVKSYPHNYSDPFVKMEFFSHAESAEDINLPFCNIQYIKRFFQGKSLYRQIKQWARKESKFPKVIIAYTLYPEYLEAIRIAKKINPQIITSAIVLDLPEYSILTKKISIISKIYLQWCKIIAKKKINNIEYFTLLTKEMAKALSISQPYCIVEGFSTLKFPDLQKNNEEKKIYQIFYAGTLHEKFGILHLLDAFRKISSEHYQLIICGYGDSEEQIKIAAEKDKRIIFLGQIARSEVLNKMAHATVIVNPRYVPEEFTKYSFPSKNMEALSSGIPFIAYKLAGIPDEYDEYINYPSNDSVEALSSLLENVSADSDGIYAKRAKRAKEWILKEKNNLVQTKKIIDLIKG